MRSHRATARLHDAAQVGGRDKRVPLGTVPEDLRQRARLALAEGGSVEVTIRAMSGSLRSPRSFSRETLRAIALSAAGNPVLARQHESEPGRSETEGAVLDGRARAGAIDLDLSVFGVEALTELSHGIAPHYSISWQPLEGAHLGCSACGESVGETGYDVISHAIETGHWPGDRDEASGERITTEFRGAWELAEVTRTHVPDSPGTGITAYAASGDAWDDSIRAARARWEEQMSDAREDTAVATEAAGDDELARERATRRATEARLAELEARAAADRATLERLQADADRRDEEEAHRLVVQFAREGKLTGLDEHLESEVKLARSMGLASYREHMARVPTAAALRPGSETPAPGESPGDRAEREEPSPDDQVSQLRQTMATVANEHTDWSAGQVYAEARRRLSADQPTVH